MKINDLLESEFLTDKDKIIDYMKRSFSLFNPDKLKIESDGLIYDGDLLLKSNTDKLKVQFKEVYGSFYCNQHNIESLEGGPKIAGYDFLCNNTKITTLKFCPQSVAHDFYCLEIKITDPKEYRFALYSEIGNKFVSNTDEINEIINTYSGSVNRKYWAHAINLLSKVKL